MLSWLINNFLIQSQGSIIAFVWFVMVLTMIETPCVPTVKKIDAVSLHNWLKKKVLGIL